MWDSGNTEFPSTYTLALICFLLEKAIIYPNETTGNASEENKRKRVFNHNFHISLRWIRFSNSNK